MILVPLFLTALGKLKTMLGSNKVSAKSELLSALCRLTVPLEKREVSKIK